MENKNIKDFESLKVIVDRLAKNLGVEKGLKEITLMNLWPEIVGDRFKTKSKAVSVTRKKDYEILIVAVASSVIGQELFLLKRDIVRKLYPLSKSLGFNIRDLHFNAKIWEEVKEKPVINKTEEITHFFVKNPTDDELNNILIPEDILNMVKESIKTQSFSSDELKDRILHTIIRDIKVQLWRKNNGFPCCKECGIPVNYYNSDKEVLCPSCKYTRD